MGRLAPCVKYKGEWRDIRAERKRPRDSDAGSKFGWLFKHVFSGSSLSPKHRPYCDQTQSLLFRLPLEVRQAVWTCVVGSHDVKIVRKMTKLGHTVLPRDKQRLDRAAMVSADPSWIQVAGYEKRYKAHEVLAEESLLPLLQTSKRVYQEALEVLYAQPRFEFGTMESFHRFLQRSPTAGLQYVSKLKIRWPGFAYWPRYERSEGKQALEHNESWAEICSAIAAMGGLRELTIGGWHEKNQIYSSDISDLHNYDMMVKIVAPLGGLTDRVSFQFTIDFNTGGDATFIQRYQDRLHGEGYTNVQLVGYQVERLELYI